VFSRTTRRRDEGQKKDFYLDLGIDEYWMVDAERRTPDEGEARRIP